MHTARARQAESAKGSNGQKNSANAGGQGTHQFSKSQHTAQFHMSHDYESDLREMSSRVALDLERSEKKKCRSLPRRSDFSKVCSAVFVYTTFSSGLRFQDFRLRKETMDISATQVNFFESGLVAQCAVENDDEADF